MDFAGALAIKHSDREPAVASGQRDVIFCFPPCDAPRYFAPIVCLASDGWLLEACIAKVCQAIYPAGMSTMNISLPDALKSFVDEQVSQRGYGSSSEYVRELIRKDQDRLQLRGLLLAGAGSRPAAPVDGAYFDGLRNRVRNGPKAVAQE